MEQKWTESFQLAFAAKPKPLKANNLSHSEQKTGAGRSVWYDRRVRNAEAAGSNPARSTSSLTPQLFLILCTLIFFSEATIMFPRIASKWDETMKETTFTLFSTLSSFSLKRIIPGSL
jgi:hypothetical protein